MLSPSTQRVESSYLLATAVLLPVLAWLAGSAWWLLVVLLLLPLIAALLWPGAGVQSRDSELPDATVPAPEPYWEEAGKLVSQVLPLWSGQTQLASSQVEEAIAQICKQYLFEKSKFFCIEKITGGRSKICQKKFFKQANQAKALKQT